MYYLQGKMLEQKIRWQSHQACLRGTTGIVLVTGLLMSAVGCASNPKVKAYGTDNRCAIAAEGSAVLVKDKGASANAPENALVISLAEEKKAKTTKKGKKKSEPLFDLSQQWVIRVAMGERPTAGYGFRLGSEELQVVDGVAKVSLNWERPQADAMLPQVMTYPCIYLQLEKRDYSKVEILDQRGKVRFTVDLPVDRPIGAPASPEDGG